MAGYGGNTGMVATLPGGGDAQKGPVLAMATENPGGGDAHKTRLRRRGRPRSTHPAISGAGGRGLPWARTPTTAPIIGRPPDD